jgi:hypothetical protein
MSIGYSDLFRVEINRQHIKRTQTAAEATTYVNTCEATWKILEEVQGQNMPKEKRTTCAETHALNVLRLKRKEEFKNLPFHQMCFLVLKWQLNDDGKKPKKAAAAVPGSDGFK